MLTTTDASALISALSREVRLVHLEGLEELDVLIHLRGGRGALEEELAGDGEWRGDAHLRVRMEEGEGQGGGGGGGEGEGRTSK